MLSPQYLYSIIGGHQSIWYHQNHDLLFSVWAKNWLSDNHFNRNALKNKLNAFLWIRELKEGKNNVALH